MNKQIKFQNAITKAGYLKKQSPGMLKLYQNRYYSYRDRGRALIWFKKQPSNIEERPKGVIMVSEIIKVEPDEKDQQLFVIHYPERQFKLKASSTEDRQQWLDSLATVQEYLKEQAVESKEEPRSESPTKKEGWKWENATSELAKKIQIQNEEIFINDSEINDSQFSPEKNREMLKAKSIVQNLQNEDLTDRLVMGFLYKKGKISQITQWKLRWFFMLSEYNLRNQEDGRCLSFSQLPEWVQTNTMYYFHPSGESPPKGSVKVKQVRQIVMEVNQNPYRMIVKVEQEGGGEREYHLGSRFMIEIKKWESAITSIQGRFNAEQKAVEGKLKALEKEPVRFESEAIVEGKPIYFAIKSTIAAIYQSKENQDLNQSRLVRFDSILKYTTDKTVLNIVVAPTPYIIEFKDEALCQQAFEKLKEAIEDLTKKVEEAEETTDNSKPEKEIIYERDVTEENSYLSKKLNKRMTKTKNYFSMAAMEIQPSEPAPKQEQGFWGRLSKMFCGGPTH